MKDTDQIAAEAWDEIQATGLPVNRRKGVAIIKSAIEKAKRDCGNDTKRLDLLEQLTFDKDALWRLFLKAETYKHFRPLLDAAMQETHRGEPETQEVIEIEGTGKVARVFTEPNPHRGESQTK